MSDIVVCSPLRTPVGRFGGALRDVPVQQLAATVVTAVVERSGLDPDTVSDVVFGTCYPNPVAPALGRVRRPRRRPADHRPGAQIDRRCGSGLQAVLCAAGMISMGAADDVIAGGGESMSRSLY